MATKPSARAVESRCREIRDGGARSADEALAVSESVDPDHERLEQALSELIGAPVRLDSQGDGMGELRIHFHSLEILDGILARLGYDADA
jgi:ParB family chromosome partitioning protein